MNPLTMFNKLISRASQTKAINHIQKPGFYDMSVSNPYLYYRNHNDYENAFGSISVIANRSMVVQPYAVDERGKRVDNHPIINALYHPNQDMDAVEFREALSIFTLVHNKTYIRVHTRGGGEANIRQQGQTITSNIIGFTFLEGVSELRDVSDIVTGYQVNLNGKVQQYTTDEVIVLKGVNPYNLDAGYSPSAAARKWMKLDDYIAEFEAGFFENGAVPKGQLVITAPSLPEYRDIKNALEQHHKGAGNNNNISYAYKPLDATGKPQNAQIEWVPFSQDNRSLDLGPLFEQVNKKIDSAYLVPASMRADNDNNTYASVRVDEAILVDNTIRPRLMKIWGKFTHELNRITGGIGVAITFDLETPGLADEDKLYAETRNVDTQTLNLLMAEGYTFKSVVEYLKTNDISVLKVDKDFVKPTATAPTVDNPVVDNGEEVTDSPEDTKALKVVTARQFEDKLEGLVPEETGYIMLNTSKLAVMNKVEDAESDLVPEELTDFGNLPAETVPHLTLLDGVLNSPAEIKELAEELYKDTPVKTVTIKDIVTFDLENSNAVVAELELTDELKQLRENFDLVPHASKFSVYTPHITLAYIKKEADLDKWVSSLSEYKGKKLRVIGLNLGDEKEAAKALTPKVTKQLTEFDELVYEKQVERTVRQQLERQVGDAIALLDTQIKTKAYGDSPAQDDVRFTDELLQEMISIVSVYGSLENQKGRQLLLDAGLSTEDVKQFYFTLEQRAKYRSYLNGVAKTFNNETAKSIREVVSIGINENLSRAEIEGSLRQLINGGFADYRATRIARTEVNLASGKASVISMENIQKDTGYKIAKVWTSNVSDPCPYCSALIGEEIPVDDVFVKDGAHVDGIDGSTFVNNWRSIDAGGLHANCRCYQTFRVVS